MAPNYGEDSDVALMMRAAQGDRGAFESLVLKYQKPVINVAYRYTGNPGVAEELAQDVFLRVYRAASSYRPDARFSTWLFTIVRNVCSNYRSREGRLEQQTTAGMDSLVLTQPGEDPEEETMRKERQKRIREAVQQLPENLRMPLILHQFQQMRYEQIAEILGITLASVKVRIHRARQTLLDHLRELVE